MVDVMHKFFMRLKTRPVYREEISFSPYVVLNSSGVGFWRKDSS